MPQHNPIAETVPVTLDKPRHLLFDFNTFADAEMPLGVSLIRHPEMLDKILTSFAGIRALMWAGLLEEDPDLTIRDVGRLIHVRLAAGGTLQDLARAVEQAVKASWPQAAAAEAEAETDPGNALNRPTG